MSNVTDIVLPANRETLANLQVGSEVRLFGTIYTMRDAGHARALEYLHQHGELPFNLAGQALFYAGPTQPVADRPFGAIGPTTASRMDFATPELLAAGINLTLGKGSRSKEVAAACAQTGSVYLVAVGGAAAYLANFVENSELVAWEDLGTEALRRLTLNGLPTFVAIDATGNTQQPNKKVTIDPSPCHQNTQQPSEKTLFFDDSGAACLKSLSGSEDCLSLSPTDSDYPNDFVDKRVPQELSDFRHAVAPVSSKNSVFEPFITFEGGEGVGKSTQIKLLQARLEAAGYQVLCIREPGGTQIGEQIRAILLNTQNTSMDSLSELLLYEAARAQLVKEVIRPALEQGKVVLCDRYYDSTFAYQAAARGLNSELVNQANAIGSDGLIPTRTILLEQDVSHGLQKATAQGADRLEAEGLEFHQKVHAGFAQLAAIQPERIKRVQCQELKQETATSVFEQLKDLFPKAANSEFKITDELLKAIKLTGDVSLSTAVNPVNKDSQ